MVRAGDIVSVTDSTGEIHSFWDVRMGDGGRSISFGPCTSSFRNGDPHRDAMSADGDRSILRSTRVSAGDLEALAARVSTEGQREGIAVSAPAVDEVVGSVPACAPADVERAVARARTAREHWTSQSPERRGEVLRRFGELVLDHRAVCADVVQLETGKVRRHALEEVASIPNETGYYAKRTPEWLASEPRASTLPGVTTTRVSREPVGVVGVISPWNYPLALSVTDAIPALAAGCPVVLKPDERTPFAALLLADLFEQAGGPPDALQVVTGEGDAVGPALIDAVDYVAFTGGIETGRIVAERAGRNLVDCSLELGGKNPFLVLEDADLEAAVRGAVQSAFTNAGQLCLGCERFLIEESVYDAFLAAFLEATDALELGFAFEYVHDVGSLIDGAHLASVETAVDRAVQDGGTVETGGESRPDVGPFFFEPTVLGGLELEHPIAREEIFGPVVSVHPVPDVETAIAAANDTDGGLHASVWSRDRERGLAVAEAIDCGSVAVNDAYVASYGAMDAPMGGVGSSGIGRRHGREGFDRYLESRSITRSRVGPIADPPGVPQRLSARGLAFLARLRSRFPGG